MVPVRLGGPALPLIGRAKWSLVVALSGANLVATFSATAAVASILPVLTRELHTDLATATWTLTVYQLASVGLVLSFGRLGDLRGLRRVYTGGCVLFILGAAASGVSQDIVQLIAARGLSGIGGAALFAVSPAIVARYTARAERGRMLGWLLTASTFGTALGPLLAGSVTEIWSWQWVFLGTAPLGVLFTLVSVPAMPPDGPAGEGRFDLAGGTTFLAGCSLLLLALNQGSVWGWASAWTLLAGLGGLATLGAFVVIERAHRSPVLDLGLFRRREFSAATAAATLSYVATGAVVVLVPLYLIQGRGLGPTEAGAFLLTQPLTRTVAGPVSGMLADRVGTWIPSAIGMGTYAAGLLLLSELGATSPLEFMVFGLVIAGVGAGLFLSPNTTAILNAVGRDQQGVGSGMVSIARSLGISVGVVVAAAAVSGSLGAAQRATGSLYAGTSVAFRIVAVCALVSMLAALVHRSGSASEDVQPYFVPVD